MKRQKCSWLLGFLVAAFFLLVMQTHTEGQECKRTLTLSDGEVVCDLTGEWDLDFNPTGPSKIYGRQKNIIQITQQGRLFEGIATNNSQYASKGFLAIQGEIGRDGFEKFSVRATGDFPSGVCGGYRKGCSVRISKDGNRIEFESPALFSVELNRR